MKMLKNVKISTILYISVISTFFFVLVVFFIGGVILPDREYSETENRKLAEFPVVTVENIFSGKFMTDFETYLSDQFINRDFIVSVKTIISSALGNKEVNGVYIGKNDRLFEVPSEYNIDDLTNKAKIINDFADKYNIENKYFILAPNSTEIIPELLPSFLNCEKQQSRIETFYNTICDKYTCIDCVEPLLHHPNRNELYLKTDHHWTSTAAQIVFDNFADKAGLTTEGISYQNILLSNSFSGTLASSSGVEKTTDSLVAIVPDGIADTFIVHNYDTQAKKTTFFEKDKLETKNQYEVFFGGNFSRIRIFTENVNGRNLLLFKDSYANCFIPMLIPHYENIIIIDPRYFSGNIEDVMADYNYTDLLFLYNLNTFLEDTSLDTVI